MYADFDVDANGDVFAVRVSFDGYGCCTCMPPVQRMNPVDSEGLLAMVERGVIDQEPAATILRRYFAEIQELLWVDALRDHELL